MLNHVGRIYLPMFQDQLRTSVLGRVTGRKMRPNKPGQALGSEPDGDEAVRSPATDRQISTFLEALHSGDEASHADTLNKIINAWRADNAASGVPVYAHLPLPRALGDLLAQHAQIEGSSTQMSSAVLEAVDKLDAGARALVSQQLQGVSSRRMGSDLSSLEDAVWPERQTANLQNAATEWQSTLRTDPVSEADQAKVADTSLRDRAHLIGDEPQRGSEFELLSRKEQRSREPSPPNRLRVRIVSSNNKGGRINSQRDFELERPSARGGLLFRRSQLFSARACAMGL